MIHALMSASREGAESARMMAAELVELAADGARPPDAPEGEEGAMLAAAALIDPSNVCGYRNSRQESPLRRVGSARLFAAGRADNLMRQGHDPQPLQARSMSPPSRVSRRWRRRHMRAREGQSHPYGEW